MTRETEQTLILRCKDGDMEAFELLFSEYADKLYNTALSILKEPYSAQDAVQDALLKTYRSIHTFHQDSGFYTWLYRILYNCCLDIIRKNKKNPLSLVTTVNQEHLDLQIKDPTGSALDQVLQTELSGTVRDAISTLKENYRMVLVLRDIEGMSYEEVCSVLGISLGTLKSRLSRARNALKKELLKNGTIF